MKSGVVHCEVKYLLDTHTVLWASEADPRLGSQASEVLRLCAAGEAVISDITLLEIAMLVSKGRIRISLPIKRYLLEIQGNFPALTIEAAIASEAFALPIPQSDPFDRVIVATAKYHALPLITRDKAITRSQLVEVIW